MAYTCFSVDIHNKIAHIELSRPDELNTMNRAFWAELPSALKEINDEAAARVVVISSTGKHFTAGMDLGVFSDPETLQTGEAGRARERLRDMLFDLQHTFNMIERIRMPVLAAVQGGCIGGGIDMISACDMRYCTVDAFFCIQEINIGMTADAGTLQRLPHLIPSGIMRELAYTGRKLHADEAKEIGLVNKIYETHEALIRGVMRIADQIASRSPLAVYGSKEALNYTRDHSVQDSLNFIATWQSGMFHLQDMMECFVARSEDRDPVFDALLPANKFINPSGR